ncbi:MAG: hypothetical protein EBU52_07135 [Cytophagia bacterium]|nr:hypothetical protein [Cytophagia bacterium]
MAKLITISPNRTGTYQKQLIPAALQPEYIAMDERTRTYLLAYCAHLARVLDYYSAGNKKDGTWKTLLCADPIILSAVLSEFNTEETFAGFLDLCVAIQQNEDYENFKRYEDPFFASCFEVILHIDEWYKLSNQNFQTNSVQAYLKDVIEQRGAFLLQTYYELYLRLTSSGTFKTEALVDKLSHLSEIWNFNAAPHILIDEEDSSKYILQAIEYGQQLFSLQADIVAKGKNLFAFTTARNDIPAHVGLLLTFLDLFKSEQEAMNTLTRRHLLFYYQEVLLGKFAGAVPDTAVLVLQLAKGVEKFQLPVGTSFSTDGGLVYESVSGQSLSSTQVVDYRTLSVVTDAKHPLGNGLYAGVVTGYQEISSKPWPFFGGMNSVNQLQVDKCAIGMAFSCADLLLAQGKRTVTLLFDINELPDDFNESQSYESSWSVELTASKTWLEVKPTSVKFGKVPAVMIVEFTLTATDPAIMAYNPKVHGEGFSSAWPVCKLMLREQGFSAYPEISQLKIYSLRIKTDVSGIYDFLLENDGGKVSAAHPFIPFPASMPGSNLYVGGQEFFVKPLTEITILISWDNLPPDGFAAYYAAYNEYYKRKPGGELDYDVFQNQSFTSKAYVLDQESWMPLNGANGNPSCYNLFTKDGTTNSSYDTSTTLATSEWPYVTKKEKSIHISFDPDTYPYNPYLQSFSGLDNNLQQGFFCITLSEPANGFGATDYANIVSSVALKNSEIAIRNAKWFNCKPKDFKPLPNAPFMAKISGVEIAYNSDQTYDFSNDNLLLKWYHIQPFSITELLMASEKPTLLPIYKEAGCAMLGLDVIIPDSILSIYFVIQYDTKEINSVIPDGLSYTYLSANGWKPLTILSDQTQGFQCSGIIRFAVPSDCTNAGGNMPPGLYWIKFGAQTFHTMKALLVATQGVEVKLSQAGASTMRTPVMSINKLVKPLPDIKTIAQPLASFGGKQAQTEDEFLAAMAVRTGYKNRALTLLDVEALVLSEFQDLFNVTAKYIANSEMGKNTNVSVVLTPWTQFSDAMPYRPIASVNQMLQVLELLECVSMSMTRYTVRNADFVQMRIKCKVTFNHIGDDEELALQLNEDLRCFLSPWIQDNAVQASTITVTPSAAYAFIKSRSYIRTVHHVQCEFLQDAFWTENNETDAVKIDDHLVISADQHEITWKTSSSDSGGEIASDDLRIGETYYLTN